MKFLQKTRRRNSFPSYCAFANLNNFKDSRTNVWLFCEKFTDLKTVNSQNFHTAGLNKEQGAKVLQHSTLASLFL